MDEINKCDHSTESMVIIISECDHCLSFQFRLKAEMEYGESSMYFPFTFTQQDIDNVLYGYIRTPEKTSNGFALSGICGSNPANGKLKYLK